MRRSSPDRKPRLGISACLLGEKVRYDGGDRLDHYLRETLGAYVEWVPVCPEVEMGLTVPREPMRLVGDPASPGLVTVGTGIDHADNMLRWSRNRVAGLEELDLSGFVFKSRSPSCGIRGVDVYGDSGMPSGTSPGIFAAEFMRRFPLVPVEDEDRLQAPSVREKFISRVKA